MKWLLAGFILWIVTRGELAAYVALVASPVDSLDPSAGGTTHTGAGFSGPK